MEIDCLLGELQGSHPSVGSLDDGNYVYVILEPSDYYRERIDTRITVYRSYVDSHPVGFIIKDIKRLLQEPALRVLKATVGESERRVPLSYLLMIHIQCTHPDNVDAYQPILRLAEMADKTEF